MFVQMVIVPIPILRYRKFSLNNSIYVTLIGIYWNTFGKCIYTSLLLLLPVEKIESVDMQ